MFESLGKMLARLRASEGKPTENLTADPATTKPPDAPPAPGAKSGQAPSEPGDLSSVPVMMEILTLLSRIEYGLDEQEIADSLQISPADALANCQALEQEMFVHHNDEHAQWFIGQRGLEFLRLNGQSG